MDKVRCPNCRGMKQVAKLGGMMGDCNMCNGVGQINAVDKPKPVLIEPVEAASDIISQVANVAPISDLDCVMVPTGKDELPIEPQIKVDPKRTAYRKKKA